MIILRAKREVFNNKTASNSKSVRAVFSLITIILLAMICQTVQRKLVRDDLILYNEHLVFGLFGSNLIAIIIEIIGLIVLVYYSSRTNWRRYFPILILAGVVSTLFDRIAAGGAIDYFHLWIIPLFNLADILIVAGLVLMVIELTFFTQYPN